MDEREEKWRVFEKTGSVSDYLHYLEARQENKNESENERDGSKAKKSPR